MWRFNDFFKPHVRWREIAGYRFLPKSSNLSSSEHWWWTFIGLLFREEEMVVLYLALACGLGALVRYFFSRYNQGSVLPLGTLIANLLGCFLIGLFYNHVESKEVYLILATGFCGGLTTFSTLNDELQKLLADKKVFYRYFLLTYLGGLLAIFLGILLCKCLVF